MNITIDQIKTLTSIKEGLGIDITEHNDIDSFVLSFLSALSTDTLDAIAGELIGDMGDKFKDLSMQELERRKRQQFGTNEMIQ